MTRGVGGTSPANVQVHLKGAHYPARKEDLIATAKKNGAPEEIMDMLGRLNDAGKTIIMVTHEEDIAEHAKRIIRMRDGQIIQDGPSPRMLQAQEAAIGLTS